MYGKFSRKFFEYVVAKGMRLRAEQKDKKKKRIERKWDGKMAYIRCQITEKKKYGW